METSRHSSYDASGEMESDRVQHYSMSDMAAPQGVMEKVAAEALEDLERIPFHEILDGDSRPIFIMDMDPDVDVALHTKALSPVFCNAPLRHYDKLKQVICGDIDVIELGVPDTVPYEDFRKWSLSVTPHDDSRDSWPTSFLFVGMLWTGSTIRRRFRIITGNKCFTSNSVTSGDLAQGPPPELATGFKRSRPTTERTTSGSILRDTDINKHDAAKSSEYNTIESVVFSQHPSSTAAEILATPPLLDVDTAAVVTDWTLPHPTGVLSKHIEFTRAVDWSKTSLGAMSTWSPELRQIANLVSFSVLQQMFSCICNNY